MLIGGAATVLVAGSAAAWALDEYVIDHVEVTDADAYENESGSTGTSLDTTTVVADDDTWSADGTTIKVTKQVIGSGSDQITYFVADLVLTDATVLRTGFAENKFGGNVVENTSSIASSNDAVFAVNGDYYGFRDTGIEIRNGTLFRSEGARQGLVIYQDGRAALYDETSTDADTLLADGAWTTLSFGPGLVADGKAIDGIDDIEIDTNFGNHSIQGQQPRTAIGVLGTNHLAIVVVDGRSDGYSRGATMTELAEIFVGLGATTAYNLDGGGSSTMYFNGSLVNNPLGENRERGTSDSLYIAE